MKLNEKGWGLLLFLVLLMLIMILAFVAVAEIQAF